VQVLMAAQAKASVGQTMCATATVVILAPAVWMLRLRTTHLAATGAHSIKGSAKCPKSSAMLEAGTATAAKSTVAASVPDSSAPTAAIREATALPVVFAAVSVDFAAVSVKSTADAGITVSAMPTMSASVTRGGEGPLRLAVSGIVLPLTHSAAVAQARALVRRAVMGPVSMEPVVAGPAHMALLALISIALFSLTEGLPLASMLPQRLLLS